MKNPQHSATVGRACRTARGFSLVEVTLAIAVVAVGLVAILGLFPLGMDAVRQAADSTQLMTVGQDNLAYFQQMAADTNYYYNTTDVILPGVSHTNLTVDGIWYRMDTIVTSSGFSTISAGGTNMISRVQIGVYRTAGSATTNGISNTNYYFTEVARYAP